MTPLQTASFSCSASTAFTTLATVGSALQPPSSHQQRLTEQRQTKSDVGNMDLHFFVHCTFICQGPDAPKTTTIEHTVDTP